jgi:hypothetical protein
VFESYYKKVDFVFIVLAVILLRKKIQKVYLEL